MADGGIGMSGHSFDAFVSSQRGFNDNDWSAKIQEKYWRARQKFLAKIEKKEDACIVLSDSKLDAKLEIYHSINRSCSRLNTILENYQNCLFVFANEENSLGRLLRECSKHDKTKAGKVMAVVGKSLTESSHQRIRLYMPLLRLYQEMDTFHSRAVDDTAGTVDKLENKRSQYRASLLWMKDISERLNPDIYRQLDKFRRVQNQVRSDKKAFDAIQMDVVQKIDLLMASRCNLMNQILAPYQATLLETFEKNFNNFRSVDQITKKEDIYEYEFRTLKQLNPLPISLECASIGSRISEDQSQSIDANNNDEVKDASKASFDNQQDALIDVSLDPMENSDKAEDLLGSDDMMNQLDALFGDTPSLVKEFDISSNSGSTNSTYKNEKVQGETLIDILADNEQESEHPAGDDLLGNDQLIDQLETLFTSVSNEVISKQAEVGQQKDKGTKLLISNHLNSDLLNMSSDEQIANLLGPSETESVYYGH